MKRIADAVLQAIEHGVKLAKLSDPKLQGEDFDLLDYLVGPHSAIEDLLSALKKQPELNLLSHAYITWPSGSMLVTYRNAAEWLVAAVQRGSAAECAAKQLLDFIENNKAFGYHIRVLSSVDPERRIQLLEDVDLIPFDTLPPSAMKQHYKKSFATVGMIKVKPTAALRLKYEINPVIVDDKTIQRDLTLHGRIQDRFPQLQDILLALTLAGPSSPVEIGEYEDHEEVPLLNVGAGGAGRFFVEVPPHDIIPVGPCGEGQASHAVRSYLGLSESQRQRLKVPLERLGAAVRRQKDVDRAIELGIALEALLLADQGPEASISLPLRLWGAWLAGTDVTSRKEAYNKINMLYGLRSAAAHRGDLSSFRKAGDHSEIRNVLVDGMMLCALLITKMIDLGDQSSWLDLILGGELEKME